MTALRLYVPGQDEFLPDGYPVAWRRGEPAIKELVRAEAGDRCVRCGHPYRSGEHGTGEWSPCDERCTHGGPARGVLFPGIEDYPWREIQFTAKYPTAGAWRRHMRNVEAQWRILTVHHLNGVKADCRWWNLAALCQRCHLTIQGKVVMDRIWPHEHTAWFRPYVAGYYASRFLGQEIDRTEAEARADELLALEVRQMTLEVLR